MPFLRDQQEEEQESPYFGGDEEEYFEDTSDPLNEVYDQNRFTDYPLNYDNMSNDTASPQSGDDYYNNMIKNERGPAQNNDTGPEEKSQEDNKKKPKEEKDNKLDKAAGALEKVPGPVGTVAKVYKHKKIIILALFVIITFQILVVVMFVGMLGAKFGGIPSSQNKNNDNNTISGPWAQKAAKIALGEVGTVEMPMGSNCVTGKPYNICAPWCAAFLSWVYKEAGVPFSPLQINTAIGVKNFYKNNHSYVNCRKGGNCEPAVGDIVYRPRAAGTGHVGMIAEIKDGYVYTVEGSSGNAVKKNPCKLSNFSGCWEGYGRRK